MPSFVIGGRLMPGAASAEELLAVVAGERERAKQAVAPGAPHESNRSTLAILCKTVREGPFRLKFDNSRPTGFRVTTARPFV